METRTLDIEGMSCGHCVARVERALKALPGVSVERVVVGSATIALDPVRTTEADLARAIDEAGYTVRGSVQTKV